MEGTHLRKEKPTGSTLAHSHVPRVAGQMELEKTKICLVSRCAWTLYNFRSGLMRELMARNYDVIGGGAGGDGFEEMVDNIGVRFHPLPVDKRGLNPVQDIKLLATLVDWYKQEKPDIVHHFTIKPVIYGSIAAKIARVPRVVNTVTGLGYVFIEKKVGWLRRIVEHLYRMALTRADITFFQNREDLTLFLDRRLISPEKAEVLPGSGVDCGHFAPSDHRAHANSGPGIFLMVSRLLRDKGVYEFVESARIVKNKYPRWQFHLLGRRDTRNPNVVPESDINAWATDGLVQWLGEVTDVREIIEQSDVVVLPSYREGTPRALLEAAAMGKPLITTDAAGCRDVVQQRVNGLLVPIKDPAELASAMIYMIENPLEREKMGREGRKKVQQEFDERIVIQRTLAAYDRKYPTL